VENAATWVVTVVVSILLLAAVRDQGATRWVPWTLFVGFVLTTLFADIHDYVDTDFFRESGSRTENPLDRVRVNTR
jgi:urea transporter